MKLRELETPAILVDRPTLMHNLKRYQEACDGHGKALWPMVKTHKSVELARLQKELGAAGFLCGTLDECETLCDAGLTPLMYAYPVADEVSCRRVAALAKRCEFYARLDDVDAAAALNEAAKAADVTVSYTLIVDCGFHRFGKQPKDVAALAKKLKHFSNLALAGISTHPGHVYGEADPANMPRYGADELRELGAAAMALHSAGFPVGMISTGSTPTFWDAVGSEVVAVFHPGNYVFQDCIQMANGTAQESDCSLTVYATVISHPSPDLWICDAGAKCLGLDKGAHGNASVQGHGCIVGHPELSLDGLSEEVGKIHAHGETDLKVGDRIRIIPNHACSAANLTDWLILVEGGDVVGRMAVDARSNRTVKGMEG